MRKPNRRRLKRLARHAKAAERDRNGPVYCSDIRSSRYGKRLDGKPELVEDVISRHVRRQAMASKMAAFGVRSVLFDDT